jgi:hypothetical protein
MRGHGHAGLAVSAGGSTTVLIPLIFCSVRGSGLGGRAQVKSVSRTKDLLAVELGVLGAP